MDLWDLEAIELDGPGMIEFRRGGTGCFKFIAVQASIDYRAAEDPGSRTEFTWEGFDEGDEISGRGWASLKDDGTLVGRMYFHMGDNSGFSAIRAGDE